MFIVILSTFVSYIFSLKILPQIANQYNVKSYLLLSPGNFFMNKFNFSLPLDLSNIFYKNMLVNQDFIYALILGAFVFTLAKLFRYIHRKISENYFQIKNIYPVTLPISNISHSAVAAPIWLGPIHIILSILGFFRIDSRGKCMLITAVLVGILPDLLLTSQDVYAVTGALREISYLSIIIPITAVLGLSSLIAYLDSLKNDKKNFVILLILIIVFSVIIITPTIATTYYLPRIAGEDYIINGMKWVGETGDFNAKVVGYGYRTIPIYTNMTDASYGLTNGREVTTYQGLLKSIYFSTSGKNDVGNLRDRFGVKYILSSDKLLANVGGNKSRLVIDNNPALNKIYSSKDFGVYEIITSSSEKQNEKKYLAGNIFFQQTGSSLQIETDVYKMVLNANNPFIEQFGTPRDNFIGEGIFLDSIQISGLRDAYISPFSSPEEVSNEQRSMIDSYVLNNLSAPYEVIDNQVLYRTILKNQQNGNNEASLLVRYTFYPTCIRREFLISHDWVVSSSVAESMNVNIATSMFTPLNDFTLQNNNDQIKRHIYPNQDSVVLNEIVQDLYVNNGEKGIYIKNEPTATYPTRLVYAGSTLYNYSSLTYGQYASLKPGASLHVTQYLSPGDEITAERNIYTQEGISLLNYPDGMIPIMLSGYRTPYTEFFGSDNSTNQEGYQVLLDEDIPYSEVIIPYQIMYNTTFELPNATESLETEPIPEVIKPVVYKIDLSTIDKNIRIIGSDSTRGLKFFDNFEKQDQTITSLIAYANDNDVQLIGYMPDMLSYNLDTLKTIYDKQIPFILSNSLNPPYLGSVGVVNKDPQRATYHNMPMDVALLPITYPMSGSLSNLSSHRENAEVFAAWNASINEAVMTDGMILFIIKTEDIGNPDYIENFKTLIAYAKSEGLTFTTPDTIANHFNKIQNIQYSGSIKNDIAIINLTNNNDEAVQQVTFRVILPALNTGNYKASGGKIVKIKEGTGIVTVYVRSDISAHATQTITIEPDTFREKIIVTVPRQLIEGQNTISIKDKNGKPLKNAYVIIDAKYYNPDAKGEVTVDLPRGIHKIEIRQPGYEIYNSILNVRGRIYLIEQFFRNTT
jgi:hypothetical protein